MVFRRFIQGAPGSDVETRRNFQSIKGRREDDVPIVIPILGDTDPGTYIHWWLQVDDSPDFLSPAVDVESKDDQTNWYFFDWSRWVALPAGGVLAYWQYEANDYDVPVLKPSPELDSGAEGYTNSRALYLIPGRVLTSGKVYYYRWRQHDGTEYSNVWHGGSIVA